MFITNPDFFYYAPIHHHPHHGRDALLIGDLDLHLRSILDYAYSANHMGGDGNHRRLPQQQTLTGVCLRPSPTGAEALRASSAPTRLVFPELSTLKLTPDYAYSANHMGGDGNHRRLPQQQTLTGVCLRPSPTGAEALRASSAPTRLVFPKLSTLNHTLDYAYSANHMGGDGNHRRLPQQQTLTGVCLRPSPTGAEALRASSAPTRLVFKKNQTDFSHTIHNASSQHHLPLARNLGELSHNKPHQAHLPHPRTALSRANFNLQQHHDYAYTAHRLGRRRRGHNRRYAHRAQQKITSEPVGRGNAARVSRARRGLS